ncbi:hypothetical protein AAHE18_04G015800 [Arachis hypogaea]
MYRLVTSTLQMADDEFDCLRKMNNNNNNNNNNNSNSKDSNSNLIWWSNDSSADTKSASSNSWESMSSTPVLMPEGMFQDYELIEAFWRKSMQCWNKLQHVKI